MKKNNIIVKNKKTVKNLSVLNLIELNKIKGGGSTRRNFDPIGNYNFFDD